MTVDDSKKADFLACASLAGVHTESANISKSLLRLLLNGPFENSSKNFTCVVLGRLELWT